MLYLTGLWGAEGRGPGEWGTGTSRGFSDPRLPACQREYKIFLNTKDLSVPKLPGPGPDAQRATDVVAQPGKAWMGWQVAFRAQATGRQQREASRPPLAGADPLGRSRPASSAFIPAPLNVWGVPGTSTVGEVGFPHTLLGSELEGCKLN